MSKGRKISKVVREFITLAALEERDKSRMLLARELPDKILNIGERPPDEETIEKMISWARNHPTDDPLDKPWSVGCVVSSPIAPGALRSVLQAQVIQEAFYIAPPIVHPDCVAPDIPPHPLTVRQALWVARLCGCSDNIAETLALAKKYALLEQASKVLGKPLDTTSLDRRLRLPIARQTVGTEGWPADRVNKLLGAIEPDFTSEIVDRINQLQGWPAKDRINKWLTDYEEKEAHDERPHSQEG